MAGKGDTPRKVGAAYRTNHERIFMPKLLKNIPELKDRRERWLRALEGGSFKQGTGQLRENDRYCCLGVACKISGLGEYDDDDMYRVDKEIDSADLAGLPSVRKVLGMTSPQAHVAACLNDGDNMIYGVQDVNPENKKCSFKEIAAFFRKIWRQPRG